MTRRVALPTQQDARRAMQQLLTDAAEGGVRPSAVELGRRLGLTNTTLWRHFPELARELAAEARAALAGPSTPSGPRRRVDEDRRAALLARDNHDLRQQLDIAAANIARLTLDNHQLRQSLENERNVTRLRAADVPASPDP